VNPNVTGEPTRHPKCTEAENTLMSSKVRESEIISEKNLTIEKVCGILLVGDNHE